MELAPFLMGQSIQIRPARAAGVPWFAPMSSSAYLRARREARREATREQPSRWGLAAMRERLVTLAGAIDAAGKVGSQVMSLADAIGRLLGSGT